jgi:hypothetical protein
MRGDLMELDPLQASVLYSFRHAREDVAKWLERIPEDRLWTGFGAIASAGFQVRHIAGSVDRLITYASGRQLSEEQMDELRKEERTPGGSREDLLRLLDERLTNAESVVRSLDPGTYREVRELGRKRIPVPLGTLLVHIAEHTQRHVGELIITVKLASGAGA